CFTAAAMSARLNEPSRKLPAIPSTRNVSFPTRRPIAPVEALATLRTLSSPLPFHHASTEPPLSLPPRGWPRRRRLWLGNDGTARRPQRDAPRRGLRSRGRGLRDGGRRRSPGHGPDRAGNGDRV